MSATLRVGLVGTGPWARIATGPGLRAASRVEPVGVWGRDAGRTAEVAELVGVPAYEDYDALLADVEAVVFSVAPSAQAELAVRAARAGRHLLLDKPVALSVEAAEALLDAVTAADVAALVFFTDRFTSGVGRGSSRYRPRRAGTGEWRTGSAPWTAARSRPRSGAGAAARCGISDRTCCLRSPRRSARCTS